MARTKTRKKVQYAEFSNCFDADSRQWRGRWHEHFGNNNPIVLELGCGQAELSYALAKQYPEVNFIGVDVKHVRMWHAAGRALEEGVQNIAFLHIHLLWLAEYFADHEVSELWITFPDPFPKNKHAKHRMINPNFLSVYRRILKTEGTVIFKTDSRELFLYALEIFVREKNIRMMELSFDLHNNAPHIHADFKTLTQYEKMFMAEEKPINLVQFAFSE